MGNKGGEGSTSVVIIKSLEWQTKGVVLEQRKEALQIYVFGE